MRAPRDVRLFRRGAPQAAPPAPWTPADIPDLVLGLDNQLVTEAAGLATAWPDTWGPGSDFSQASPINQPNYIALEPDFPAPQPAVKFDGASVYMDGPILANIAWVAIVAVYPATTFADLNLLFSSSGGQFIFRGNTGTADWYTAAGAIAGTRYRDGVATDAALTTANAPHLYEFEPAAPWSPGTTLRLSQPHATRRWSDSVALVLAATSMPDAPTRAALLAYCQGRGMVP